MRVAEEIDARDVVMMPDLGAAEAGKILLRHVRAGLAIAVGELVVDPLHLKAGLQGVPRRRLVSVDDGAGLHAILDEGQGGALGAEHGGDRLAAALADDDDALALAGLVLREAPVAAVLLVVGGLGVAAEVPAIDLDGLAFTADRAALQLDGHGLAQLVQQHEGALVGDAEIARESERGLALHLVHEHGNGGQVGPQRQLVRGEQRARRDREILAAGAAAEAGRAVGPTAVIGVHAATVAAHRLTGRLGPAEAPESGLGILVRHAHDLSEAHGLGAGGEEKVLSHSRYLSNSIANECDSFDRVSSEIYRFR